jgi:hypothetical protein
VASGRPPDLSQSALEKRREKQSLQQVLGLLADIKLTKNALNFSGTKQEFHDEGLALLEQKYHG